MNRDEQLKASAYVELQDLIDYLTNLKRDIFPVLDAGTASRIGSAARLAQTIIEDEVELNSDNGAA